MQNLDSSEHKMMLKKVLYLLVDYMEEAGYTNPKDLAKNAQLLSR
jgi:hypothetical protein